MSSIFIGTNPVILACKCDKVDVLKDIFLNNGEFFNNAPLDYQTNTILPNHVDEMGHNAFYYAISSGNIELLDTLIDKWPGDYFKTHLEQLDELLSKAFDELKLKNVPLTDEAEIFVANRLINLCSHTINYGQIENVIVPLDSVKKRIKLVIECVVSLREKYANVEVNFQFLLMAKFIAQNVHVLKQLLRSTYDRLPWEEIEYCLVGFISSYVKRQEINLFYNSILNKETLIKHLDKFAMVLKTVEVKEADINSKLPKLGRDVVKGLISRDFCELYNDYEQIRDPYSLEKINSYIEIALSVNCKEREGQLIIIRTLQVIGEYIKNTLESPKLSSATGTLLFLSLPMSTCEIVVDLRNALSHARTLSKRIEIEESADISLFTNIQNDIRKIGVVITDILFNERIKIIRMLLNILVKAESLAQIKDVAKVLRDVKLEDVVLENFKIMEHEKMETLIKEFSDNISDKNRDEEGLFKEINSVIHFEKSKFKNGGVLRSDYVLGFTHLKSLCQYSRGCRTDDNFVRSVRFLANLTLKNISPKMEPRSFDKITKLIVKISDSVTRRMPVNLDEIERIACEICVFVAFGIHNIKWIEELTEKLGRSRYKKMSALERKRIVTGARQENYDKQLLSKLSELDSVLKKNVLNTDVIKNYSRFKKNKTLQVVIEMLTLDILSILDSMNCLSRNILFLDDYSPLLGGKSLRNHLAHGNFLYDILCFDTSSAILVNAVHFIADNLIINENKIVKSVRDDLFKLKVKYDSDLAIVTNQENMFQTLEDGNIKELNSCIMKGACIKALSIILSTSLHFASKGPNIDTVKFVLKQNVPVNATNVDGWNSLHVAAAYGRCSTVRLLIERVYLHVDGIDDDGQTPLHLASQSGHRDVVKVLLKNKADTNLKDKRGNSPLHYAVLNDHKDVVNILLEKEVNVDINEVQGGYTLLHIAAERGNLDLVSLLLENNANVNAENDKGGIPLHTTALFGHLEVVKILILNGSNVNARNVYDCTPLHYAVEYGHENVVEVLLEHGATANVNDRFYLSTPLHYAAIDGHEGIVKALLKHNAIANSVNFVGMTPMSFAVKKGHLGIVVVLLNHGVDIHDVILNGMTLLHLAAEGGHGEIVELLTKNKVGVNAKDNDGCTPLHKAVYGGHDHVVDILMKNAADVNASDALERTPLIMASMRGHKDTVVLLIKYKAIVNVTTHNFCTPLYVAALYGHIEVVDALLKNNAIVNRKDTKCISPLFGACINGHNDIIKLLIENNADVNSTDNRGDITQLCDPLMVLDKETVDSSMRNDFEVGGNEPKHPSPLSEEVLDDRCEVIEQSLKEEGGVQVINGMWNTNGFTPLHVSSVKGHNASVDLLIKNNADVNARIYATGFTPLHVALKCGQVEVVEVLIANGADVNARSTGGKTPLLYAVSRNLVKIVKILLRKGAFCNANCDSVHFAVFRGYKDVLDILLQNVSDVGANCTGDFTLLHHAARGGHGNIANYLIDKGAIVNAKTSVGVTPLHVASFSGFQEVVQVLVRQGADVDTKSNDGLTALHMAARNGHSQVVEALLNSGAKAIVKDNKCRTPIELATACGRLETVQMLLQNEDVDINARGNNGFMLLHVAAEKGHLEIVRCLLENGADSNIRNDLYSKPVYLAAREGHKEVVKYFLDMEARINTSISSDWLLLHYAALKGSLGVVIYLIEQGFDVNAKDANGTTLVHIATSNGVLAIVEVLLNNGAIYNAVDTLSKTPLEMAKSECIINLLLLTEEMFTCVKHNRRAEFECCIGKGAPVNAKDRSNATPLHYAAWKGHEEIVDVLLRTGANPSAVGKGGCTPLHYASKFGHLTIVKALLTKGAIYSVTADNRKTPSECAVHRDVVDLFTLVDESFAHVRNGDCTLINILNNIKDVDTVKAVMNAHDTEHRSLVVVAYQYNFPKIGHLKGVLQNNLMAQIDEANKLCSREKYRESLKIYNEILEKRNEILGPNNPGTLDIQYHLAYVLYKQANYEESLKLYEEVYRHQCTVLGFKNEDTLRTRSRIALVLHRRGRSEEAHVIFEEVYGQQRDILGKNHSDAIDTQFYMALVLNDQGNFEEALNMNKDVFEKWSILFGRNDKNTLSAQNNIALVLHKMGKYDEALKVYQEVYKRRKLILGVNHSDTLRTLHNMAGVYSSQNNKQKALNVYKEVLKKQEKMLGPSHVDTLYTQYKIAELLFLQGKRISALKTFVKGLNQRNIILGPSHLYSLITRKMIKDIHSMLEYEGYDPSSILQDVETDINIAVGNGDKKAVQYLINNGADVNVTDADGKTPLHIAVFNGNMVIVNMLLSNNAHVIKATNKGITPLYTASRKGYKEIVEALLRRVNPENLTNFVNSRTKIEGVTALHVAANVETVKLLLSYGAVYNVKDGGRKTPLDLSTDQNVCNFLRLTTDLFEKMKNGNFDVVGNLQLLERDEFVAITNARNNQGNTLLEVATKNKHKKIECALLKMMQR